jgi:hypothetical protein
MQHVWARGEVHIGFLWGDLRDGDHLKDPGVDGMIILKLIFKTWDGGRNWMDMAQDRDRWRALIWQRVQNTKLFIMQFYPPSCYFLPPTAKYSCNLMQNNMRGLQGSLKLSHYRPGQVLRVPGV